MRDHLIGYLLDALDPEEHEIVEAHLSRDPQLKRELELLSRSLLPLVADKGHYDAPPGLAHRTCEFVAMQSRISVAPAAPGHARSQWRMADMLVAAGIFLAATMLFFPALNQSRFAARLLGCQNNLREIGMALTNYSDRHKGYFPDIPRQGRLSAAGIYATKLVEGGYLGNPQIIVCPASSLADGILEFQVPTSKDLQIAPMPRLVTLHKQMGGSYGYNIGYVSDGRYRSTKNLRRKTFALMADAPAAAAPYSSPNHGRCGQNVLFEDLHVQYLTTCKAHGCRDNIFLNDDGLVAAGTHVHDAVVGASHAKPLLVPVVDETDADR
jgi:hypothetical protein